MPKTPGARNVNKWSRSAMLSDEQRLARNKAIFSFMHARLAAPADREARAEALKKFCADAMFYGPPADAKANGGHASRLPPVRFAHEGGLGRLLAYIEFEENGGSEAAGPLIDIFAEGPALLSAGLPDEPDPVPAAPASDVEYAESSSSSSASSASSDSESEEEKPRRKHKSPRKSPKRRKSHKGSPKKARRA